MGDWEQKYPPTCQIRLRDDKKRLFCKRLTRQSGWSLFKTKRLELDLHVTMKFQKTKDRNSKDQEHVKRLEKRDMKVCVSNYLYQGSYLTKPNRMCSFCRSPSSKLCRVGSKSENKHQLKNKHFLLLINIFFKGQLLIHLTKFLFHS